MGLSIENLVGSVFIAMVIMIGLVGIAILSRNPIGLRDILIVLGFIAVSYCLIGIAELKHKQL